MSKLFHGVTVGDEVAEVEWAADYGQVGVLNFSGTDVLLVRVDGGVPSLANDADGRDTRVVPPGARRVIDRADVDGPTQVRLLSSGVVSFELEV